MAGKGTTPNTALSSKPRCSGGLKAQVLVAMTPAEREEVETIAAKEMRSLSATVRMLMSQGLRHYRADGQEG